MITKLLHKIVRFLMRILSIFPIKKNRILFNSQKGRMFACNPRAIFELLYNKKQQELEFVWCLNEPSEDLKPFAKVKTVKYNSLYYFYYQMTSKVIVANIPSPIYVPLRKKQVFLNTWHGGGAYKKVGLLSPKQSSLSKISEGLKIKSIEDKNNQEWERYKAKYNAKDTTFFISSCKKFTDVMLESQLLPLSAYLEIGMPRNDVFFSDYTQLILKAKIKLGIPSTKKVVLFAPTYRGNVKSQSFNLEIDIKSCLKSLKSKWGGEWVFVFRGHVLGVHESVEDKQIVNASKYEEMQELLCMADVFITDYSSSMWDFALTKKPAFLFTPDLEYYLNSDRGFYTPIEEWAFSYAKTNNELSNLIETFDDDIHQRKVQKHMTSLISYEEGNATEKCLKKILVEMEKNIKN